MIFENTVAELLSLVAKSDDPQLSEFDVLSLKDFLNGIFDTSNKNGTAVLKIKDRDTYNVSFTQTFKDPVCFILSMVGTVDIKIDMESKKIIECSKIAFSFEVENWETEKFDTLDGALNRLIFPDDFEDKISHAINSVDEIKASYLEKIESHIFTHA